MVWSLSLFRPYLLGRRFEVITCNSLTQVFGEAAASDKRATGRLARWAMRLQEFNYKVRHRPGLKSANVDCCSRQTGPSSEGPAVEPLYAPNFLAAVASSPTVRAEQRSQHIAVFAAVTRLGVKRQEFEQRQQSRAQTIRTAPKRGRPHPPAGQRAKKKTKPTPVSRTEPQRPSLSTEIKLQLDQAHSATPVVDLLQDLKGLLLQAYKDDKLAQHVLVKNARLSINRTVGYFLNDTGLIKHRMGGVEAFYVPTSLRSSALHTIHGLPLLGHLGFKKSWPAMTAFFLARDFNVFEEMD